MSTFITNTSSTYPCNHYFLSIDTNKRRKLNEDDNVPSNINDEYELLKRKLISKQIESYEKLQENESDNDQEEEIIDNSTVLGDNFTKNAVL